MSVDLTEYKNGFNVRGIADEQVVIDLLKSKGFKVRRASRDEDYHEDIDIWLSGTPVSIKSQKIAAKTHNFSFELEVLTKDDEWLPSWFYRGRAKYYIIKVEHAVFQVSKRALKQYLDENGWDRTVTLSKRVRETQVGYHRDALSGLVSIAKLLQSHVAWRIA